MSKTVLPTFLFVAILIIQTSNVNGDLCNDARNIFGSLSSLVQSIVRFADNLEVRNSDLKPPAPVVRNCDNLKNGEQYYLQTLDGRFVVYDPVKRLGFVRNVDPIDASKFTATKVGCNSYGLCVHGHCMSRCMECSTFPHDLQSVKFHLTNSDEPYSRWTLVEHTDGSDIAYSLKIDGSYGYWTYLTTVKDGQLTLTTGMSYDTSFKFVEVSNSIERSSMKKRKTLGALRPRR